MDPIVVDIVALIRGSDNISSAGGIIITRRNVGRNLVTLNGHR